MYITIILPERAEEELRRRAASEGKTIEELIGEEVLKGIGLNDPEVKAELYVKLSERYLQEAEALLARAEYTQASEKAWGAATEMVKAVAARRGIELRSHSDLWRFVTELVKEVGDEELGRLWHVASSLHVNFYEAWATPELVKEGVDDVKRFIERLRRILS